MRRVEKELDEADEMVGITNVKAGAPRLIGPYFSIDITNGARNTRYASVNTAAVRGTSQDI